MTKCPYCGRTLREHERYCDFCEQDLTDVVEGKLKPKKKKIQEHIKEISRLIIKRVPEPAKKEKTITAYCVKCRKKVSVKNPRDYTMKNKRLAVKGVCPFCSTGVFRILGIKSKEQRKK